MKLERFNGKKFEALSDNAMAFVVGGYYQASGPDQSGRGLYSRDYIKDGVSHYSNNGANADWSDTMMTRFCGENWQYFPTGDGVDVDDPVPGDEYWDEWQYHAIDGGEG